MRIIKFRAWDKEAKIMTPGETLEDWFKLVLDFGYTPNNRYEWMQFTGLHDKNGKEIYEGDILKFYIQISEKFQDPGPQPDNLVCISMKNGAYGFYHLRPELVHPDDQKWRSFHQGEDDPWSMNYFEVVGNIYENPKLIQ